MKLFKEYLSEVSGLRYIYDCLNLSSIGRKCLLNQRMFTNDSALNEIYLILINFSQTSPEFQNEVIPKIQNYIAQINDIETTLNNLKNGIILDDIELFEIKKLAIYNQKILELIKNEKKCNNLKIFNLQNVIKILNPDDIITDSFYIFSSYNEKLNFLRNEEKKYAKTDEQKSLEIRLESLKLEQSIREDICHNLRFCSINLLNNLLILGQLDLLLAKFKQGSSVDFPLLFGIPINNSNVQLNLVDFWNPEIQNLLNKQTKIFQSIDIQLNNEPVLIMGANMSGKTVILKTVALLQILYQFGFMIPAKESSFQAFDEIITVIGDKQSESNGLSSFASEMLAINDIIKKVKSGKKLLVCVDELARTTNPHEGKAIVSAFLDFLKAHKVNALISTHYDIDTENIRKLRVKGLNFDNPDRININNINDFMDYSLLEIKNSDVPNDALKIAKILNVDEDLITQAEKYL